MIEDLSVIISMGESYTVEFKKKPDKTLVEEVCAFANSSGGKVYIGIDNDGKVCGTDVGNTARSRIQDSINSLEPHINVDIAFQDNIFIITVPEGNNKPYSCSHGFFIRIGPNTQKLDRDSIMDFFQSEGHFKYDEVVRDDLPVDGKFNEEAYKSYIRAAKISDILGRDATLINLKCAAMVNSELCFNNAGAMFFRKNDEDMEFRHAGIVCVLFKGTGRATILDAKELNGDAVSNIDNAVIFLKKHLRISYVIKTLQREEILELPEDALREAIINAVCHRLWSEKGARIMVEIFDDRVDIVSPGGVCKGITPENFGTISITRNPLITGLLHRIHYIEQMGTGIKRMREATEKANVAEPVFELENFFKTTFKRTQIENSGGVLSLATGDKQAITSDKQAIKTSERILVISSYIEKHGKITASVVAELLKLSNSRARAILNEMVKSDTIEKIGDKKSTHYILRR